MNSWIVLLGQLVGGQAKLMTSDQCQPVGPSRTKNALYEKQSFPWKVFLIQRKQMCPLAVASECCAVSAEQPASFTIKAHQIARHIKHKRHHGTMSFSCESLCTKNILDCLGSKDAEILDRFALLCWLLFGPNANEIQGFYSVWLNLYVEEKNGVSCHWLPTMKVISAVLGTLDSLLGHSSPKLPSGSVLCAAKLSR